MNSDQMRLQNWPWAGVFGGVLFWYTAHELGLYFSYLNCWHGWIVPAVQLACLAGALVCALASWKSLPPSSEGDLQLKRFGAVIGTAAGCLFSLVIIWQAVAAFVYDGCFR